MSSELSGTTGPAAAPSGPAAGRRGPTSAAASQGAPERDWTVEVSERIESVVGAVREKTTVPITKIARLVVFGLVAAVAALVALVVAIDALVRIVDVYLPFDPYGRRVWVGYAGLGAIFLLAGTFCWTKRSRKPEERRQ